MNMSVKSPVNVIQITNIAGKTYDYVELKSQIREKDGKSIFEKTVIAPVNWSQNAVDILSQKYFRKKGVPYFVQPVAEEGVFSDFYRSVLKDNPEASHSEQFTGENSAHQVFHRLAGCWTYWGIKSGYFNAKKHALEFYATCYDALYKQIAAPNSPQFFNTGLNWAYGIETDVTNSPLFHNDIKTGEVHKSIKGFVNPQVHACFILSIADNLVGKNGIIDLVTREAAVFKYGSGAGSNFSNLRALNEPLSSGGVSSGLMSFLKVGDASAGAIKSGGASRRAAKMLVLDVDHPEIEEYVMWKVQEENKVAALISGSRLNKQLVTDIVDAKTPEEHEIAVAKAFENNLTAGLLQRAILAYRQGTKFDMQEFDSDWQGDAYYTVSGQNANNSVSITDDFFKAVETDGDWELKGRKTDSVNRTIKAKKLWETISFAAWASADPGLQYADTMNMWNTCSNDERIRATNPCCFVGETLVDTAEGRIRFDELEHMYSSGKKMPMTFAFDRKKSLPVLKQIRRVWVAGKTKKLIEVTTEKGVVLRCTPEHRFLLRNGEYVEARDLRIGDSLRKISRVLTGSTQQRLQLSHRATEERKKGFSYQNRWMWEQAFGDIPDGFEVHHINEDCMDDRLSNFELKDSYEHRIYHSEGAKNPRYIEVDINKLVEIADAVIAMPLIRENSYNLSPSRWNKYLIDNNLSGTIPKARGDGRIQGMEWVDFLEKIKNARAEVNDRVLKIERIKLDKEVKVYDMEVDGVHNFAVVNSVDPLVNPIVVHNSEYIWFDDTACNLASLNLVAIYEEAGKNVNKFIELLSSYAKTFTTVLDISIQMAQFPSYVVAEKTWKYRTLGLGYGNIGSLLMRLGVPYGEGNSVNIVRLITAIMHGSALLQSAKLASGVGAFPRFEENVDPFMKVMNKHRDNLNVNKRKMVSDHLNTWVDKLATSAQAIWDNVVKQKSFRNAQVTVLAPMGTIGLIMDCFSGKEKFFNGNELVRFKDMVNQKVTVTCADGKKRPAIVKKFGNKPLNEIEFKLIGSKGSSYRRKIRATSTHRWLLEDGTVTTNLKVGDKLSTLPVLLTEYDEAGFMHGLMFADGWKVKNSPGRYMMTLYGDKQKQLPLLQKYASSTIYTAKNNPRITVISHDIDLKQLPINQSDNYVASFIKGWLEFDAWEDRGSVSLSTAKRKHARWLEDNAPYYGYQVVGSTLNFAGENSFKPGAPLYRVRLRIGESSYKVSAITQREELHQTYCVVEPETQSFTLSGGIVTGNCDTTGIEPDFSLVKHKKLAGGGYMKFVNQAVPEALRNLGYENAQIEEVCAHISGHNAFPDIEMHNPSVLQYITVADLRDSGITPHEITSLDYKSCYSLLDVLEKLEKVSGIDLSLFKMPDDKFYNTERYIFGHGCVDDCNTLLEQHKAIFDCAVPGKIGGRALNTDSHLNIMAAAQEFISGGISKTINLPYDATIDDISTVYKKAHSLGIKAVSVYRDGSKLSQPLMSAVSEYIANLVNKYKTKEEPVATKEAVENVVKIITQGTRRRLDGKRSGYTQKIGVTGHSLYIRTGEYKDGKLGEIFLDMQKQGGTFRALLNSFAIAISMGLQYGVPLEEYVKTFVGMKFEPAGPVVGHDNLKFTTSLMDAIFRDLAFNYLDREDLVQVKSVKHETVEVLESKQTVTAVVHNTTENTVTVKHMQKTSMYTGTICSACGGDRMITTGTCETCSDCGQSSGCA